MKSDFWKSIKNYRLLKKILLSLRGGVVYLHPKRELRGNVLLSYITLPFVISEKLLGAHTNRWECREIARLFLESGYAVDVIDWTNTTFKPKKNYKFFIDIHNNLERLSPFLNKDCIKIFHATGAHWEFQNNAEQKRLIDIQRRRNVKLLSRRAMPPSHAIERADIVTMLGNDFTESTYAYAHKKITRIPLSTTHIYPSPTTKNFDKAKTNFVWFGGSGMVHKGLDLVLEAFAQMPEYHLTVCGKVSNEKDFENLYKKELYQTPNIKVTGLIDPGGLEFQKICNDSIALIYPSSSEGQSGAVITTMHAGLIPIVSYQSGVDVEDFGILLKENTLEEICKEARMLASLPPEVLKLRAMRAWTYARTHYTREMFSANYKKFINGLIVSNKTQK